MRRRLPCQIRPTIGQASTLVGHVGYGGADRTDDPANIIVPPSSPPNFFTPTGALLFSFNRTLKPEGALAGGQFGYNYQVGSVVFGFEADVSWLNHADSFNFSGAKTVALRILFTVKLFGPSSNIWGHFADGWAMPLGNSSPMSRVTL